MKKNKNKVVKGAIRFRKEQLLASKRYAKDKDLINAILEDKEYSLEEVDKAIKTFKEREVM